MTQQAHQIKQQLSHPVIDGDGHHIEYLPYVRDLLAEDFGSKLADRFNQVIHGAALSRQVPHEKRRAAGLTRTAWWGLPARNTLDRATAMLPALLHERLDEFGIDFALLYPTYGLTVTAHPDDELRPAMARAFNRYSAEVFAPHRDRLEPVAAIPMATPQEALDELDFAVGELGLKAVMMAGIVARPVPGVPPEHARAARYIDTVGHDSLFDYDPVWQKCAQLKVAPTFHAGSQGLGMRASRSNYVYNHIGNFAAAGEAAARSLFFGGVPMRHPSLRFAFMEGGVAWGANLLADILGHHAKRNPESLAHYDPAQLDRAGLFELLARHGSEQVRARLGGSELGEGELGEGELGGSELGGSQLDEALVMLSDPDEPAAGRDEFAESGVASANDIIDIFARQYFFGCEADDPMNAVAFARGMLPHQTQLNAVFASDIGHWDVPDMSQVLPEAHELLEHGHLSEADFKQFAFTNAVRLWGGTNPDFFEGTSVAAAAAAVVSAASVSAAS